jgi:hypothetical protein
MVSINVLKPGFKGSFMEKRTRSSFLFVWQWMVPVLALLFGSSVLGATTFSVTPSSMADNALGPITLQIGGLQSGETVHVGKYLDANANGVVDPGDTLMQAFQLIDGQITVIGGVTNVNIPGDLDAASGSIKAQLNLKTSGVEQKLVGKYLFMVISPTGRFAPITAPFQISNAARGQSISGNVQSGGSAVPNAMVLLFTGSGDNMNPQGGIIADNAGHFSIQATPGTYSVAAFRSNYVAKMSTGPSVTLTAGGTATANVTLDPPTCSVSGRVTTVLSDTGLPGVMVPVESENGDIAIGFTDTDGAFKVPVTSGQWKVQVDSGNLSLLGIVSLRNSSKVDTGTGSVSGLKIAMPGAEALFYGHIRDEFNQPMSGVSIYGNDNHQLYEASAVTDDNGRYVMGVTSGGWYLGVDNNNPSYPNYLFTVMMSQPQMSSGEAFQQHFTGSVANYHVSGNVKANGGAPVANVGVYLQGSINGDYYNAWVATDDSGHYSMPVAPGNWQVGLSCDGDNGLAVRGFSCVTEQPFVVSNADVSVSFTVSPCLDLAVRTSSLPNGQSGSNYSAQLEADGCQSPFHWSLAPGSSSLPDGLYLDDNGNLSGQCNNSGNFTFTVRVTDATQNSAQRQLSIQVTGNPLQIDTFQLPAGTLGLNYSAQLSASGGLQPYVWSMAPGSASLPANITLSTDGILSGTTANAGTFYFYIRVTDAASNFWDQFLSITVNYPALVIETSTLPNATVGLPYESQLVGVGGLAPYYWSLALGSANLPPGLNLGTNGVISGTATSSGSFNFRVNLRAANFESVNRSISIQIQAAQVRPSISAPSKSATASQFQFTVNGIQGQMYTIETTPDFKQWTPLMSTNAPAASFLIQMDRSTNRATFYRVKSRE